MRSINFRITLLVTALVLTNCSSNSSEGNKVIENDEKVEETEPSKNLLKHSILDEEVEDNVVKTQVALEILLESTDISEEGVRTLLDRLYNQIKSRTGFKYYDNPTAIYIYAYTSKEKADSGMGQWVGMLSKNHNDTEPQIRISEVQLKAVSIAPQERFGFKEKVRQVIWTKLAKIELIAQRDADSEYPINHPEATEDDFRKNSDLSYKLQEKYQKELAKEYKTSVAILDSISNEASVKGWAIPKP